MAHGHYNYVSEEVRALFAQEVERNSFISAFVMKGNCGISLRIARDDDSVLKIFKDKFGGYLKRYHDDGPFWYLLQSSEAYRALLLVKDRVPSKQEHIRLLEELKQSFRKRRKGKPLKPEVIAERERIILAVKKLNGYPGEKLEVGLRPMNKQ